jgi:basic membrane lipoprotein Med (substrate-binding protein (PBP1-ABC) superfamily)
MSHPESFIQFARKVCPLLIVISLLLGGCQPAAQPTAAPTQQTIKVAFAHTGPITDEGWTWSHDQARKALEAALPNIKTVYVESMPYSEDATRTLEQFVADGAKMVFVTSGYADYLYKVVEAHPDVAFLECGSGGPGYPNLVQYAIDYYYPAYLMGMAAGLLTKTNKLGYVGSFPGSYTDINAFTLGAQSVNPQVTMMPVYVNSWFDPSAETQAANALIDSKVDVLYGIMDDPAYLKAAEERGVWAAMWNTDMRKYGPKAYISSVLLNWNDFYIKEVQAYLNGTWKGGRIVYLPLGQGVDRDAWGENVPKDVQQRVDAVREKMLKESYNPFVGPIYDVEGVVRVPAGQTMSADDIRFKWDWAVQGVIEK